MTRPRGWFAAHRMDENSSYYQLTPNARSVWWELLGWTDRKTGTVSISLTTLARRSGVTKELVRRCLGRLVALGMVQKIEPNVYTPQAHQLVHPPQTYKVVNWFKYQADSEEAVHHPVHPPCSQEQEVASPTEKRAARKAAPKASPFPPAFWRLLKHHGCPALDGADKGQVLARLKAGEDIADIATKIVIGIAYGAKSARGALTYSRQFNDPITRLEMDDVRANYARLAAQDHGAELGSGRRAGDPASEPSAAGGLPGVGEPDATGIGDLFSPRREAGAVQDDVGVDDGGEPRARGEASLLDWIGDAARADGCDVGVAACPDTAQAAGGCLEAGGRIDLR